MARAKRRHVCKCPRTNPHKKTHKRRKTPKRDPHTGLFMKSGARTNPSRRRKARKNPARKRKHARRNPTPKRSSRTGRFVRTVRKNPARKRKHTAKRRASRRR